MNDPDPPEDPIAVPIEDALDLHAFLPPDIPSVVDAYVRAAHEAGFREVRLIHGRGRGIQRATVQRVLNGHPLVGVLRKGVVYHHAALPADILETIESGIREDQIRFIASTTSLTEGVNLPVRTVILAETNYDGQPVEALLRGARLLSAMGRAGRACKECEGWVVLVRPQTPGG